MNPHCPTALAWVALLSLSAAACGGATIPPSGEPKGDGGIMSDSGGPNPGFDTGTPECNIEQILPPVLTVTDQLTGDPICDAVLVDNDAGASLEACTAGEEGCAGTCQYTVDDFGGGSSSFSIVVSAPGYAPKMLTGLTTRYCGCDNSACQPAEQDSIALDPVHGTDGGLPPSDAGSSGCPASTPTQGGACTGDDLTCEYGTNPNPYCNDIWECENSAWQDMAPSSNGCAPPNATCPDYATISGTSTTCGLQSQTCDYSQGTCVCTSDPGGLPTTNGPFWSCTPITTGCPGPRPLLGTDCSVDPNTVCDYGECSGGVAMTCTGGYWSLAMDIACAG